MAGQLEHSLLRAQPAGFAASASADKALATIVAGETLTDGSMQVHRLTVEHLAGKQVGSCRFGPIGIE
jgi:hypothetical protein